MMPFGKDGGLHVYHDQVVRAIHDVSILPPPPKKKKHMELCVRVYGNTPHAVLLWTKY